MVRPCSAARMLKRASLHCSFFSWFCRCQSSCLVRPSTNCDAPSRRQPDLRGLFSVPRTQSGETFRLRGRGMPDVSGRGRGDLLITVNVVTPKKLTKDQKKLLDQLAESLPKEKFEPTPVGEDKGIFDRVKDIFG